MVVVDRSRVVPARARAPCWAIRGLWTLAETPESMSKAEKAKVYWMLRGGRKERRFDRSAFFFPRQERRREGERERTEK